VATDPLFEQARRAQERAHAPYSRFRVGAALETESGEVFVGSNVENGSYGLTMCAERVALGAAVSAGHRRFRRIAVSTDAASPTPPCGACRQVLAEFGLDLRVLSEARGKSVEWRLRDLLPEPFLFDERADGGS
jgi:cytidine deaminase